MNLVHLAPHGWSLGPWVYPELRAQCGRAAAGLHCVRPCCRKVLAPGEAFWQRQPNDNMGNLMVNPHDGIQAVERGYWEFGQEQWPCVWDDARDPWVLRLSVPAKVRLEAVA